jgi:thioredoxin reductase (NADPH)
MNDHNKTQLLDVLIIGAGPIGLACGIEACKAGLSHLIIDKGCLVNSIYNYPLNMAFFSTSERLEIGDVPFISHQNKPNRSEALEYYRRVASHWKLNLKLYTTVNDIIEQQGAYVIETSSGKYSAKALIIATGFFDIPNTMGIEGESLPKVHHYYKEAHPYFNQRIAVVGAANSAVDVALETFRKGAQVTMIIREDKISDRVKYWVKPDIENRIKEGSVKAYFNSTLLRIKPHEIDIHTPAGELTLPNDFVMAMTGYKPDFTLLIKAGIEIANDESRQPAYNPSTMETNRKNIYLAGVICGGINTHKWFIENSRPHASFIMKDLAGKLNKI